MNNLNCFKEESHGRQVSNFNTFIETCFLLTLIRNIIFCPILREKHQVAEDKPSFLNNVVIRPELTLSMKRVLPDNQNIILIGDIYEGGKLKMLQIKGLQLIDDSMESPYDLRVDDYSVCNSFERGYWSINHVDYNDTFFA